MKNNEIMLTVQFNDNKTIMNGDNQEIRTVNRIFSFLVLKDITLRELIEGIYFGLLKRKNAISDGKYIDIGLKDRETISDVRCFDLLETYLKHRSQLILQYMSKTSDFNIDGGIISFKSKLGNYKCFDKYFKEQYKEEIDALINENENEKKVDEFKEKIKEIPVYDLPLEKIGIVTGTRIIIDCQCESIILESLFQENIQSYIIKGDTLEYNISTRSINVVEPSIIEIQPAGNMPRVDDSAIKGALITSGLSIGLGILMRLAMTNLPKIQAFIQTITKSEKVEPSPVSAYGSSMIWMSVGMGLISAITLLVNSSRQNKKTEQDAKEWKSNYEKYIIKTIKKIVKFQKQDIVYLNTVYPQMEKLFHLVEKIDGAIFCRSQSDDDFLTISLGISDQIEPLFEIKYDKKDLVIDDSIQYKLSRNPQYHGDIETSPFNFELIIPNKKHKKKSKKEENGQSNSDLNTNSSQYPLISDIAYNFANNPPVNTDRTDGVQTKLEIETKTGFKYLKDYYDPKSDSNKPPLLFKLGKCGALGVISDRYEISQRFIRHIIFELSFYHSPENLQFVVFFKRGETITKQNEIMDYYRFLPHANELFENVSQFIFNKKSAGDAFSRLLSIFSERKGRISDSENTKTGERLTHVVCILFDDYDIKESGFSRFLPEPPIQGEEYKNELGLTFIVLQDEAGKLPKYCGSTINLSDSDGVLRNRYNILTREILSERTDENTPDTLVEKKTFEGNFLFKDEYTENEKKVIVKDLFRKAYMQLSAIYYKRIAENGKVPSVVSLFEIWGIKKEQITSPTPTKDSPVSKMIMKNWNESDITEGLNVPIGKNEHGITMLDMHQNGDGPHGLVAGTTGSGKSETLITYVIGCCMKYKPEDLNFMLVDMKGGGFSDRLGRLPHLVGAVTNTTGEEEGIAAEYMLKRFLETLNSEIKRRELILKELDTDNIDSYIRARKEVIEKRKKILAGEVSFEKLKCEYMNKENRYKACNPDKQEPKPLAHLLLIVDEFTELKRFSSESNDIDFIKDITTIARVGRTLGFHIILVSQNIEGAITEDIRVNSKARICLKVATKSASKDMIGTNDAAAATMPGNGRAYILVGTGSRYEYFQSAWTAANRNMSIKAPVEVTCVSDTGEYEKEFYNSADDNIRIKEQDEQVNQDDTQLNYIINAIQSIENDYNPSVKLFLPPLKADIKSVMDDTEWEM